MKAKFFNNATFVLTSILLMSIGFVSCNNDDDELTSNYTTSLIGKCNVEKDKNPIVGAQWFKDSNVKFTLL